MSIDIKAILKTAVAAATDEIKTTAPAVTEFFSKIADGHENAIKSLAEAFAAGDIDEDTFKDEIDDEGKTLEAELQAVAALSKAIAQRAINAFRKLLVDGITAAIKAI